MSPQHRHQPPADLATRARAIWTVLGRAGRVGLVLGLVAGAVVLAGFVRFVAVALTARDGAQSAPADDEKEAAAKLAANIEANLAQFNGRSMFFTPPAPRREVPRVADDSASKPPPPPSPYGGPSLVGFAHDAAFFSDGRTLRVGDESDKSLKVLKMDAPWNATVLWENVEFKVSLFDKDKIVLAEHKPGDKPIEGEPASDAGGQDPNFIGPPRPPESTVASETPATTAAPGQKPTPPTPPQGPQDPPASTTEEPTDPNGARS